MHMHTGANTHVMFVPLDMPLHRVQCALDALCGGGSAQGARVQQPGGAHEFVVMWRTSQLRTVYDLMDPENLSGPIHLWPV